MNNVYFGNEGMTSTTANYYANIASELKQAATERLNNVRFYNLSVAVIGSHEKQLMSVGNKDLGFIDLDLQEIASMNAFCAWVREAIKEKDEQISKVNNLRMEDWTTEQGINMPLMPSYPEKPEDFTETDVMNSWDINKRNKYLKLEAFASTYGKFIHPEGSYNNARKNAHYAVNNPITKEGTGRDMLLYYKEPSVSIQDVDKMFLTLQEKHREYEKELNCMKAELIETMNDWNRQASGEFQKLQDEYNAKCREYNSTINNLRTKFLAWKRDENERISKLKITIPDSLKATFKIIKEVGDTSK
jgi:uncharacterized protein YukE